jgi:hypothetical protein
VEWDNSDAVLWAYSYVPDRVASRGITVWEFGADEITTRTANTRPDTVEIQSSAARSWSGCRLLLPAPAREPGPNSMTLP